MKTSLRFKPGQQVYIEILGEDIRTFWLRGEVIRNIDGKNPRFQ